MQNIIQNIINVITNFYNENQLLVIFIVLNIFNVIIQTVKSIATIKCKKLPAALINAVAYGLYTVVTVYMMCELPLGWKAGIVAACNLIGVYIVKDIEERKRKDKKLILQDIQFPKYLQTYKIPIADYKPTEFTTRFNKPG